MEKIAVENGSMISASLLGALAGSGALPFPRESYEQTIGAGGRGVKASLAAFGGGYDGARRMPFAPRARLPQVTLAARARRISLQLGECTRRRRHRSTQTVGGPRSLSPAGRN